MKKIYVVIYANGYDSFDVPYNSQFYLTETEAQQDADRLNRSHSSRDSYFVEELTLKTK